MRPILLRVAGLQSYREQQEIRFEELTETGLFGIFGPTGSGKSTLLDAITLAMYGKVERAVNGTQGIMNHAEDTLSVAFTFELMSAQGPKRYRVERRFKRAAGVSVSNSLSRFVEITDEGEQVMADKLADVTRCVEDIIGLKMDDFTRAVVLPQGKFAEFLSLKGSERRQMLQRLFHLEKYGDQLAQKLSRRVKDTDSALKSLAAEQQGLGNASADVLKEAELRLRLAVEHALSSRAQLEVASREAEAMSKIRDLEIERQRRTEELQELAVREREMAVLEKKLKQSAAAWALQPALEDWKQSATAAAAREAAAAAAAALASEAEEKAEQAVQADERASQELAAEEPRLLLRIDQLEQAMELQKETDALRTGRDQLAALLAEAETDRKHHEQELQKERELHSRGLVRQKELQEQLKPCEVKAEERRLLQEAMQRLQQLKSAAEQLREAEQEAIAEEQRLRGAVEELSRAEVEVLRTEATRTSVYQTAMEQVGRLLRLETECVRQLKELAAAEEALRSELRAGELRRLAQDLAAQLQDGEPCPVCGSLHHPAPAEAPRGGADHAAADGLQRLRAGLQELRLELRQQLHERRSLVAQLQPAGGEADAPQAESAAGAEAAVQEPPAAGTGPHAPSHDLAAWQARCGALEHAAAELAAAAGPLREQASALREAEAGLQQRRIRAAAEHEAAAGALAQAQRKRENAAARSQELRSGWEGALPGVEPDSAEQQYRAMQERDMRADEIRARLETSVTFLEEKSRSVQLIEQTVVAADKLIIARQAELQGKDALLREKMGRLQAWIGGGSAQQLLADASSRLSHLKLQADACNRMRKEADERKHETAKASVMARQAADSAAERRQAAETRWCSQLEASPFASEEEVLESSIEPEHAARLEAQVNGHREREKEVAAHLRHLEERLAGTSWSAEEWNACIVRLRECREQDEEALRDKAKAERDMEDLQQRHVRWMELESRRGHLQREAEKLAKLQSCLRGNAFVEYVAEEQLMQVSQAASRRLRFLTKQRYALEVDSGGGFIISDDANGGIKRPVSTLSGGETFLTSLSLALALSAQIQLRGQFPLQFFFLDEGFGTLDPELLDTVITSLEKLHHDQLSVGVISHVPELRARLPRKLVVLPAEQSGGGSRVVLETL
ncbi:SMC family ATPase [Paenibacillus sp. P96]|uniref:Nuclease SbcCD subunit C n=1 Tax=Paenibacillus zeirhizosphaerae TaxID=2987519 RepID=A0ABT9FQI2_9BACL|nr:SMC family ATPase [Paenibacillus sp. P96]MDP4096993.1 SMC family ATPase [Paenibacillus sp. P96]